MDDFKYMVGSVGDVKILRYKIPGWELLTNKQKNLLWCLYNASLHGRDIYYDQSFRFGLYIRKVLEMILKANLYVDPPSELTENTQWKHFMEYIQLYWMNRGIHDDTSGDKVKPKFTQEYFINLMHSVTLPQPPPDCNLLDIIFDNSYPNKKSIDSIENSATNFYFGITTKEAIEFHHNLEQHSIDDNEPEEHGLNSQLIKHADGHIEELKWFTGGMYATQLRKCVEWLTKALPWTENNAQKTAFESLIKFYETGSLKDWIIYCKHWVADTESTIDMIHGFIETYDDPLGHRGSFEAVVTVIDPIASKRIKLLQENAQWFEDNSPVLPQHKRKNAKGVNARVVNVVIEAGDAAPRTAIGINLPNAEWFRSTHGSKSINMANIVNSYNQVSKQYKVSSEFFLPQTYENLKNMSNIAMDILVDMHEVLGHGSGLIEPHVGDAATAIGGTFGILEEARADLFACYYIMDPYVVEIGLLPDLEAGKTLYDTEITNGLMMQLNRVPIDKKTLTDTHMRDRQLIASWVYERAAKDKSIVKVIKNKKTYFEINNYDRCRVLFGELLCEIQRIKSQGDRKACEELVEKYGTHIDHDLHKEVLNRFSKFNMPPMSGFIQPELSKDEKTGEVTVTYPVDFIGQMIHYSETFS